MIRKDIKPGTKVFNEQDGVGTFFGNYDDEIVKVTFEKNGKPRPCLKERKYLTEIESEPKKEQEFNPPV